MDRSCHNNYVADIKKQLIEFQKNGLLPKNLSEVSIEKTIQKGSVFLVPIEVERKYIKDKKNNTPDFVKYSDHKSHPWLFLRNYRKDWSSGVVRIVNRSTLKKGWSNVSDFDYPQIFGHKEIDKDHPRYCQINEQGVYKNNLKHLQTLDKEFLNELDEESRYFNCMEPEIDIIVSIIDKEGEVYD